MNGESAFIVIISLISFMFMCRFIYLYLKSKKVKCTVQEFVFIGNRPFYVVRYMDIIEKEHSFELQVYSNITIGMEFYTRLLKKRTQNKFYNGYTLLFLIGSCFIIAGIVIILGAASLE
jgi:hypothetical protein